MGDHSSRPYVAGRLKRPTRRRGAPSKERAFGRAALCPPPYLVLHREEFAWPRVSPRAPVRSYFKPRGAAPFHPSPAAERPKADGPLAGLFSVALVVARFITRPPERSALNPAPSR